ncbi:hypothetical protein Q1695_006401 [Nippostrongylus brasiliensis]|nr:hypothetical protein Q1695_006401 [Nippostrongylus brasiliensis]
MGTRGNGYHVCGESWNSHARRLPFAFCLRGNVGSFIVDKNERGNRSEGCNETAATVEALAPFKAVSAAPSVTHLTPMNRCRKRSGWISGVLHPLPSPLT